MQILKAHLQNVLVQVYYFKGERNSSFKKHLLLESYYK